MKTLNLGFFVLILFLILGCTSPKDNTKLDGKKIIEKVTSSIDTSQTPKENLIMGLAALKLENEMLIYKDVKNDIFKDKTLFGNQRVDYDSLSHLFEVSLLNRIIPFWEGTPWTFEGHTSVPQSGTIACGYFVSTTLQDIGLNINRYALAQQSPINEAKSLALSAEVKVFSEAINEANILAIRDYLKEGIHFIGFDQNHVGFILKKKNELYLIHSNYLKSEGVIIEPIEASEVFKSYTKFYIVELSTNKDLLKRWINNDEIKIIME